MYSGYTGVELSTLKPVHDRMIIQDDEQRWFQKTDVDALHEFLDLYPDDGLKAYERSTKINHRDCDSMDMRSQSGLGEF